MIRCGFRKFFFDYNLAMEVVIDGAKRIDRGVGDRLQ
jgi:hypothetical protein